MNGTADVPRIRVLLVDDQALVRAGFRLILQAHDDLEVVGEAASGAEALELTHRLRPDVVLLDIQMPGMSGLQALPSLLPARVVVLTTFELDEYVYEALRVGARGFLLKNAPPEELVQGVRAVAQGGALLAPSITSRLIEQFAGHRGNADATTKLRTLSERELEILLLIARGMSNAEIASECFLSEETVKSHVSTVLRKLAVRDRVQAAVFAYEAGAVSPRREPPTKR